MILTVVDSGGLASHPRASVWGMQWLARAFESMEVTLVVLMGGTVSGTWATIAAGRRKVRHIGYSPKGSVYDAETGEIILPWTTDDLSLSANDSVEFRRACWRRQMQAMLTMVASRAPSYGGARLYHLSDQSDHPTVAWTTEHAASLGLETLHKRIDTDDPVKDALVGLTTRI